MPEVLCAGILVADTFCGPLAALPVEGQLLAVDAMPVKPGGCAANVAIDLAKQGFAVEVAGCMGRDSSAKVLLDGLGRFNIGCRQIAYTDRFPTSTTVILLVQGQDRRFIHCFGANKAFEVEQIKPADLEGVKVFYLGGLFAMPGIKTDKCVELLAACRKRGITTVVDVVLPHYFDGQEDLRAILPQTDYFVPNDDEARLITKLDDPAAQVKALLDMGAGTVVVTQGKDGALAGRCGTAAPGCVRLWRSGIYKMNVVDGTGSGDAFASGVVAGILRGYDLPDMLETASALGASATRAIGTTDGVFIAAELAAFLKDNPMTVREVE